MKEDPEGQTSLEDFEELEEPDMALSRAFKEAVENSNLESTLHDVFLQNVEKQVELAKEILQSPPKTLEDLKTFAQKQYQLNQRSLQIVDFVSDE